MTYKGQIWKCNVCGNIIEVLSPRDDSSEPHEGADALVCCGQPMNLMEENSVDASVEKHVPVIDDKKVKVGSVPHPMDDKHYIEWIEATSATGEIVKVFLSPGMVSEAEFNFKPTSARGYCNLHGLWKSKF
ncbi:MAG: desulfoferrodoxin FeS4 iron-binding domain-containing protein [Nanoarchaeota archaeon]|nr:desulfoferrodoxin FeS4 iron-binding domain-containing protein [Nanoarchaeota archaeon]